MSKDRIRVIGARQNNLKDLNLELPLHELIVVTGVSGSGKSSLAFDTIYSEGQRRYVETFSPYARQFLDRMDKPSTERIDGIPPAIAIDQTNPVRTSRSTVGTMTELNDHLKLLFARAADLFCRGCGQPVMRDTPQTIATKLLAARTKQETRARLVLTFDIVVPDNFAAEEIEGWLAAQGYTRIYDRHDKHWEVIQDRLRADPENRTRLVEGIETALKFGRDRITIHRLNGQGKVQTTVRYSSGLHCANCDIHYQEPIPNNFSFNSPVGACESCRGFGRTMGIDYRLVIPDELQTLAEGAIKPWQSASYQECQEDLIRYAKRRKIPINRPWKKLTTKHKYWVLHGEGSRQDGKWYGVSRFFAWLETKAYKMHIRVLLSKYRSYETCTKCRGARLKPEALLWRLGSHSVVDTAQSTDAALPGMNIHDIMLLPLTQTAGFFSDLTLPAPLDEATKLLLGGINERLRYLVEIGLGYLTLDRQSRTLSGGEVQRINLTTALGTSLVNTLFVLDEPSIGLHARDMRRVIEVLHRLRDAGNSLLVVEHDEQVMLAADRVIDLGPGPGENGGNIVFSGTPRQLLHNKRSLTGAYLSGRKSVYDETSRTDKQTHTRAQNLKILGASEHNLANIDVEIPLRRLVCITGVSGSGKSTLIETILYRALRKIRGKPVEAPGKHRTLQGVHHVDEIVLIDQSPIGKTTRSNPASYVGALDPIRKLFAKAPLAISRGYTAGTFSFNTGDGRCPNCKGNGFEHIEMQFLSDVYLRCSDCAGRRYRPEILEVKLTPPNGQIGRGKSIADVLEMTVSEALIFFAGCVNLERALEPLHAVGLSYMQLGQPVPSLSGGEAQRLKLAGQLAKTHGGRKTKQADANSKTDLLLFDEPTTGLHFDDIATLLKAFTRLLEQGRSLVVIEHNLNVIRAADWIIDLGPEGGDDGGRIVALGTPAEIKRHERSHTGQALAEGPALMQACDVGSRRRIPKKRSANTKEIGIVNARENNLKSVDIRIPHDRFTVITGVSGSGKSTVAFDILFAEGQRRYLESLNAYARQFVQPAARPEVDIVSGIPPTVAIEQRTSRGGRKSTVATLTEIYHFLRLLFVKLGTQYCPDCDLPINQQSEQLILARILKDFQRKHIEIYAPLVVARKGYYTDLAKWAANKGFDTLRVDGQPLSTAEWPRLDRFKEHNIQLPIGAIRVTPSGEAELRKLLTTALDFARGAALVVTSPSQGAQIEEILFSTNRACPSCGRSFEALDPRLFSFNSRHGWCQQCFGTGAELEGFDETQSGEESLWNDKQERTEQACGACAGTRLRREALSVRFQGQGIADLSSLSIATAQKHFSGLKLSGRDAETAKDIVAEIDSRLTFLNQIGLSYLSLDRAAPSLSGGEAQRIRLAAQLGSNLRGVCYILDEPTIGLHPRDNRLLLAMLESLQSKGNTVVVVEHDEDTIRRASHLVDLGPGAGMNGGEVIAEGKLSKVMKAKRSTTGRFLTNPLRHPLVNTERAPVRQTDPHLRISGADVNNLKGLDLKLPVGRLVCISGVSGSGKSTLVREVLQQNLFQLVSARRKHRKGKTRFFGCKSINGAEQIARVLEVDQTPIGKTPRSCPATYVGMWGYIRRLFAETVEARMRGYKPNRFSFNVAAGRCNACDGQGMKKIEMSFLPNVKVLCDVCAGTRFNSDTLGIIFKGKNIAEVLAMSVDQAIEFFATHEIIRHPLQLLHDVGLGYLTLGQPSPTLSGGEAQRIKLITELAKAKPSSKRVPPHTLYVLDEPTIGLHMADVEKLIRVLHRLVGGGNSVVVIEHNLDIIAEAEWLIDLGPEAGDRGGRIVAQGTPQQVSRKRSHTGVALKDFLAARS